MDTLKLLKNAEVKHNKLMKEFGSNRSFKPAIKYFKRLNVFKASNVTFDPTTIEATSYDWWSFVKVINGKVVFNNYTYSSSTSKHQHKVSSLMRQLGIKIDMEIASPNGLQSLNSAIEHYKYLIGKLETQMANPKSHKAKNIERLKEIKAYQHKIKLVHSLFTVDDLLNYSVK